LKQTQTDLLLDRVTAACPAYCWPKT